jgi:hypothetical protein
VSHTKDGSGRPSQRTGSTETKGVDQSETRETKSGRNILCRVSVQAPQSLTAGLSRAPRADPQPPAEATAASSASSHSASALSAWFPRVSETTKVLAAILDIIELFKLELAKMECVGKRKEKLSSMPWVMGGIMFRSSARLICPTDRHRHHSTICSA